MEEFNSQSVEVTRKNGEYVAKYKSQYAFGKTEEEAINKVKKFYLEFLENTNKNSNTYSSNKESANLTKSKKSNFTWTGLVAWLSALGFIPVIITLINYRVHFLISLIIIIGNLITILMMFELKSVVEKHL